MGLTKFCLLHAAFVTVGALFFGVSSVAIGISILVTLAFIVIGDMIPMWALLIAGSIHVALPWVLS